MIHKYEYSCGKFTMFLNLVANENVAQGPEMSHFSMSDSEIDLG